MMIMMINMMMMVNMVSKSQLFEDGAGQNGGNDDDHHHHDEHEDDDEHNDYPSEWNMKYISFIIKITINIITDILITRRSVGLWPAEVLG